VQPLSHQLLVSIHLGTVDVAVPNCNPQEHIAPCLCAKCKG
jgi:hypothetical protein